MAKIRSVRPTYSTAFKLKVIEEVESGLSVWEARRRYNIGGKMTIDKWIKSLGNSMLRTLNKEEIMSHEANKVIEQLKKEKAQLEAALNQAKIEKICLESLVEATEEHFGINLKKNFGEQALKRQKQKRRYKT